MMVAGFRAGKAGRRLSGGQPSCALAHTLARPNLESRPGCWTHRDDCRAALDYLAAKRLNIHDIISETHSPEEAPEIYARLAEGRDFPIGVVFDWNRLH